jgi:hypothetical protein
MALEIKHALRGSYCGLSCSILIDSSVQVSQICIRFVHLYNLPQDFDVSRSIVTGVSRGLVVLPSATGVFQSHLALTVDLYTQFDIVLGIDWIQACHPFLSNNMLSDPSEDARSLFPVGHSWMAVPVSGLEGLCEFSFCCCCLFNFLAL